MLLGPYSPTVNGPILPALEAQADFMLKLLEKYQKDVAVGCIVPKREAVDDFLAHHAEFMRKRPWIHGPRSGKSKSNAPLIWPGTTLHYLEMLKEIRNEDWHVTYTSNRFTPLGDGISQVERDQQGDLAWYLRKFAC